MTFKEMRFRLARFLDSHAAVMACAWFLTGWLFALAVISTWLTLRYML